MSTRQGSASYTIVIGGVTAVLIGALMLTFVLFPFYNAFSDAPFMQADTAAGVMVVDYTLGMWRFWGGVLLLGLLSWIWVVTRQ